MVMTQHCPLYVPGDLLVLLGEVQDLQKGFYVVRALADGWAVLRKVVDDEVNGRLWVTEHETALPLAGLELFMPVGIRLAEAQ
jgi:hypothetical protein